MFTSTAPRQPAPILARGAIGLRLCIGPNAFGNALGSSIASANWGGNGQQGAELGTARATALQGMSDEEYQRVVAGVVRPGLSESASNVEIMQGRLAPTFGDEWNTTDTGWREELARRASNFTHNFVSDVEKGANWVADTFNGREDLGAAIREADRLAQRDRQRIASENLANGFIDNGLACVPAGSLGSPGNPGSAYAVTSNMNSAYNNSFDQRIARSTNEGIQLFATGAAVDFVLAPVFARGGQLVSSFLSNETKAYSALQSEFRLGLSSDLAMPTPTWGISPQVFAANSTFKAASKSGLEFESTITRQTDRLTTYDLSTNQRIMQDGSIVNRSYQTSYISTTFDEPTGHLFIDKMGAQSGHYIGREMLSNVIESIGPQNIRSIGAEFADTNLSAFKGMMGDGMTAENAAINTPLGKALRDLGYGPHFNSVDPIAYPRPTVNYVIKPK